MKKMISLLFAATLTVCGSAAVADESADSNAQAGQEFAAKLERSQGVMVRVPVTADGQEDSTNAEMRVLLSEQDLASPAAADSAFERGLDASIGAVLSDGGDSSTNHSNGNSYGWNSWNSNGYSSYSGYGYNNSYYHNSYRPTYRCGNSYNYNYSRPVHYDHSRRVYTSGGYWQWHPYRYYYYRRGW